MKLSAARLDTLVWLLIYGGLFAVAIGTALWRRGQALGVPVIVAGVAAATAGVVLIWLRARMDRAQA